MLEDVHPWPMPGMSLFSRGAGTDSSANAVLRYQPNWCQYATAYTLATELLLREALDGEDKDLLVYPILFNARQAIELWLKDIIQLGALLETGIQPIEATHRIDLLWGKANAVLVSSGEGEHEGMAVLNTLMTEFHDVDRRSTAFRYPVNVDGDPSFKLDFSESLMDGPLAPSGLLAPRIDLANLSDVLLATFNFLGGARDQLSAAVDARG